MAEVVPVAEFGARSLRLDTLVRLRWLAVAGQTVAVVFVNFALGFRLPIVLCLGIIALSAWLNLILRVRYPASQRLGTTWAAVLLAYDACQLGALLYLTGGLENPFAILLLVPVIVSATTLGAAADRSPRRHRRGDRERARRLPPAAPLVSGRGSAPPAGLCRRRLGGAGLGLRLHRRLRLPRRRGGAPARQALNATEMVLAREQHLSALDGLAAAAAHELGTPLATIALVAKELERGTLPGSEHADDIALLRSQSQRCRDILARLTSLSSQHGLSPRAPAALPPARRGRRALPRLLR